MIKKWLTSIIIEVVENILKERETKTLSYYKEYFKEELERLEKSSTFVKLM
jgi:hypothetical protein